MTEPLEDFFARLAEIYTLFPVSDTPNDIIIRKGTHTDYRLVLSCPVCPEAWDVFLGDREVGYLRLRHGYFSARFPDCYGKVVFETTEIQGDGCFADEKERMRNLKKAITRIHREVKKRDGKPPSV
jgi:hypothetical protein